jgi:xanthine/CO dehydrogenase XdhC/CoxF family maturation factor
MSRAGLLLGLTVLSGCEILGPGACTADMQPAVIVTIVDEATGEPRAENASGFIRDGEYEDSLQAWEFDEAMISRLAGLERPGVYSVVVEHPGYMQWRVDGVRAEEGGCHVRTVSLRAELRSSITS